MLLFERLVDLAPQEREEAFADQVDTRADLALSVRREIGRLLQTRRAIGVARALDHRPGSVEDYGIPDASALSPHSIDDRAGFAQAIRDAIASYEPRLENPAVEVHPAGQWGGVLRIVVSGHLRGARGNQQGSERLSFAVRFPAAD